MLNTYDWIKSRQSELNTRLCIGLDPVLDYLPTHLKSIEGFREFCIEIYRTTKDLCCCYKINFAFFECFGIEGTKILKELFEIIGNDRPIIADAKRNDIGHSSRFYAEAIFDYFKADAVTVNPYMGFDSVMPFLEYSDKLVFLLALTSNSGSKDFQRLMVDNSPIYEKIVSTSKGWSDKKRIGYVIGATHHKQLEDICQIVNQNMLLIPGVGAQGGDIERILQAIGNTPAIINVSRDIIFTSTELDYIDKLREKAIYYRNILKI